MYLPREILMGQVYQLQHAMAADYKTCLIFDNAEHGLLRVCTYCEAHNDS